MRSQADAPELSHINFLCGCTHSEVSLRTRAEAGLCFESSYWKEALAGAHVSRLVAGPGSPVMGRLVKDVTRPTPQFAQPFEHASSLLELPR